MQKAMLSITTQLFQSECGRQHFLGGTAVVERGRVLATDEQHVTKGSFCNKPHCKFEPERKRLGGVLRGKIKGGGGGCKKGEKSASQDKKWNKIWMDLRLERSGCLRLCFAFEIHPLGSQ